MSSLSDVGALRAPLRARAVRLLGARNWGAGAPTPDDLVQMTMLRMGKQGVLEKLDGEDLRRYCFRTLHTVFIDNCIRRRREALFDDAPPHASRASVDSGESPELLILLREATRERQVLFQRALARLKVEERSFLHACFEHDSAPRAQELLGWPPGGAANACKRRNSLIARIQRLIADLSGTEDKLGANA